MNALTKFIHITLLLVFTPLACATNGYFSHGTGIKNRALAGAGVAFPQDAMAGATNPAGMAFVGDRFDIGALLFSPDRNYSASSSNLNGSMGSFTVGPDSETSGDKLFLIPSFGFNKMISEKTAIGFSIYGNGGLNSTYDGGFASFDPTNMGGPGSQSPGVFGAGTAGVDLTQLFFNFSLAHKLSDDISVGISPIFAIQSFRANGLDSFAGFTKTFAESGGMVMPDNLSGNGQDYALGGGVQLGLYVKNIANVIDLGASYRSKIYMQEFDDYSDLFAEDGDFDVPPTLWLGFAIHPSERVTLVFDYQRIWYEEVDSISNDVQNLSSCGAMGNFDTCLGGDDGGGFGWRNIDILKFGVQWDYSPNNILRLGFSHADQAIPSDQTLFNILAPGVIENHITAGYMRKLHNNTELNLELMYALEESVEGSSAFDPTQTIEIEMQQFELGLSWSKKF